MEKKKLNVKSNKTKIDAKETDIKQNSTHPVFSMPNSIPLNELNLVIKNSSNTELINEQGCTIITILMQNDGKVLTSFVGDYNKSIIKTLQKVTQKYYKRLNKTLFREKEVNSSIENNENL